MERIRRGELWTVELVAHPKPRVGLVVSIDPINDLCPDVLIIPVTSRPGPLRVELVDVSMSTGLRLTSFAKCESVGPVHKSRLKQRIGSISQRTWPDIEAGLERVLGLSRSSE